MKQQKRLIWALWDWKRDLCSAQEDPLQYGILQWAVTSGPKMSQNFWVWGRWVPTWNIALRAVRTSTELSVLPAMLQWLCERKFYKENTVKMITF